MEVKKILIADDDLDEVDLLTDAILQISPTTEISYVTDGVELMNKLLSGFMPDILILDLKMPCKDGKECLSEIRAHEHLNDLTVIMYSISGETTAKNSCIALGANYFVTKPSSIGEIRRFCQTVINRTFALA